MELEYHTVTIPIENFQNEVQKLVAEGWEVLPGSKPVAVYHLVRIKKQPVAGIGGLGSMNIDESKISIIRGGKVVG